MDNPRGIVRTVLVIALVLIAVFITWVALTPFDGKHMREKTYRASQHYDARLLVAAESAYYATHRVYTSDTVALGYRSSRGDQVQFGLTDSAGWRAVVWHTDVPVGCEVGATGLTASPPLDHSPCRTEVKRPG